MHFPPPELSRTLPWPCSSSVHRAWLQKDIGDISSKSELLASPLLSLLTLSWTILARRLWEVSIRILAICNLQLPLFDWEWPNSELFCEADSEMEIRTAESGTVHPRLAIEPPAPEVFHWKLPSADKLDGRRRALPKSFVDPRNVQSRQRRR